MRLPVPVRAVLTPVAAAALVLLAGSASADIYTYTDSDGVVHFTNNKSAGAGAGAKLYIKTAPKPRGEAGAMPFMPSDTNPERFTRYDEVIRQAGTLYQIPVELIRALIKVESDYDPRAVSIAGARGLMQMMPATAERMQVRDMFDPRESIFGGVRYMRIQTLDRLESVMGKNEQISMEKFKVYIQMNDNKQALNEIESLAKKYPQDNRYQVLLADAYMQNNKKVEAYSIYNKVLAAEPDNSMALYSLANYYKVSGEKDKYENQLSLFVLNKKVASEAKIDVMKELISQYENDGKDSTKVIGLFDKIIREDSEDVQIPMLYANYLIAKGLNMQALPVLEHIVALDPSNVAARLMLLNNAIKKEDYKAVIRICEPGIEATPDALELYFYLAIAYNQAGRTDDAINTSKKALTHVTSDSKKEVISDFYALMGDVYYSKLAKKEAYAAYD